MKRLLGILLVMVAYTGYGQALHIDSTRFITGNKCCTNIRFTIPTTDKGILFVGEVYGNPGGIIPYFAIDTGVNGNVLVGKIDSNQQISWIRVFGGTDIDFARSACETPDGGYAILAQTFSNNGNVTGFKGQADIWVLKIDGLGNLQWQKTYGSSSDDEPISIANTKDSGLIILGDSNGSDGDVPFHFGSTWIFNWVLIKTDSVGNLKWCKNLGGTAGEESSGSILAVDSFYYLISSSASSDHDCTDNFWHPGINTLDDYYILKLNDTGKVLWDSSYGGSSNDVVAQAIFDYRDSTIVIIGSTTSTDYYVTDAKGNGDFWFVKLNLNGSMIMQKILGSYQEETAAGICCSNNNGYLVYGATFYSPHADTSIIHIGRQDCWIFNIDNSGNIISNKIFGGTEEELPRSIFPYKSGYVACGVSASPYFTEGANYGNTPNGGAFMSYIDTGQHEEVAQLNNAENRMMACPNPANMYLNIYFSEKQTGELKIINAYGQTIYGEQISNSHIEINIADWNAGVYCIVWHGKDGGVLSGRFVKL